jgi:pSer/pThr/pTyr-binding forkhead associated (FHA) protein
MNKSFTVGRGSVADIQTPKAHDAVGKVHLQIEDLGDGKVRVTDLKSTNGTFLRAGKSWEEIKAPKVIPQDAEIMLGDYQTTPRKLLALPAAPSAEKKYRSTKEETPPTPPAKKRTGPRRNQFGEIVHE